MKKTLLIALAMLCCAFASAQSHFGVIGGASFSNVSDIKNFTDATKSVTRYHAGITYQYKFLAGFAIQPSLMYHCKDARTENLQTGYLELPVGLQWGPDLILFRPYVEVAPMVGVAVTSQIDKEMLNRLEYGVGVGGGIEIWHLQISARYNWDLNPYIKSSEGTSGSYRCATLSLAIMF